VTVLRIDTDGRIRTLFPLQPWGGAKVRGGRTHEVLDPRNTGGFTIEDDPGIGYLFAISSPLPFQYDDITRGDYWDFRVIDDGRIQGDPYVALTDLADRISPRRDYHYDITPYYVERRYDYPRFVCYDCHSYASYDEWDPYTTSCARFRVVIYDDPAYYPYRIHSGRGVVMPRPRRMPPRYVFEDASPGTEYVTRLHQRNRDRPQSGGERGRTSADVGGRGAIPAPGVTRSEPEAAAGGDGPRLRREAREPAISPPPAGDRHDEGRRSRPRAAETPSLQPVEREPRKVPPVQRGARNPQSTGEPELRRRKP
jgi:hypothetical protein